MAKPATGAVSAQYVPMDAVFSDAGVTLGASVGDQLRQARQRAGHSLQSAAAETRIKPDYLEALEGMDPRGLPSRAYAVGYLRTYAAFLRLDVDGVIQQFRREVECESGRAQPTGVIRKREIKLPRGLVGAVLILGGVIGAASWYGSQVTNAGAFADAPTPGVGLVSAPPAPLVEQTRRAPSITDIWSGLPAAGGDAGLVLAASAPTFLEVRDGSGRILFSRDLAAGEAYRAPDEPGLTITAADAGAVSASARGVQLGRLGETGEIVENMPASEFMATALASLGDGASGG